MRGWYDIANITSRTREDSKGALQSEQLIKKILDEETSIVPSERVILGGFSQGGAMAALCGLRYPKRLAGIVSCSGYVLQTLLTEGFGEGVNHNTPFIAFHGHMDTMVAISFAGQTYEELKKKGINIELKLDPVQSHEVTEPQIDQLVELFQRLAPPLPQKAST